MAFLAAIVVLTSLAGSGGQWVDITVYAAVTGAVLTSIGVTILWRLHRAVRPRAAKPDDDDDQDDGDQDDGDQDDGDDPDGDDPDDDAEDDGLPSVAWSPPPAQRAPRVTVPDHIPPPAAVPVAPPEPTPAPPVADPEPTRRTAGGPTRRTVRRPPPAGR